MQQLVNKEYSETVYDSARDQATVAKLTSAQVNVVKVLLYIYVCVRACVRAFVRIYIYITRMRTHARVRCMIGYICNITILSTHCLILRSSNLSGREVKINVHLVILSGLSADRLHSDLYRFTRTPDGSLKNHHFKASTFQP